MTKDKKRKKQKKQKKLLQATGALDALARSIDARAPTLISTGVMSHPRVVVTNARKDGLTLVERYRIVAEGVAHHKATRKQHSGSGFGAESADAADMLLFYQELAFKVANEAAGILQ